MDSDTYGGSDQSRACGRLSARPKGPTVIPGVSRVVAGAGFEPATPRLAATRLRMMSENPESACFQWFRAHCGPFGQYESRSMCGVNAGSPCRPSLRRSTRPRRDSGAVAPICCVLSKSWRLNEGSAATACRRYAPRPLLIDPIPDHGTLRCGPQRGAGRLAYAEVLLGASLISSNNFDSDQVPTYAPHPSTSCCSAIGSISTVTGQQHKREKGS